MNLPKLISQFNDEVEGVAEYAGCAKEDQAHKDVYRQMAQAEYEHATSIKAMIDECSARNRTAQESEEMLKGLLESVAKMTADGLAKAKGELGQVR